MYGFVGYVQWFPVTSTYSGLARLPCCGNDFQEAPVTCVRHQDLCREDAKPGHLPYERVQWLLSL